MPRGRGIRPAALAILGATLAACAPSASASTTVGVPVEALAQGETNGCVASIKCTYYQAGGSITFEAPEFTVPVDGMIVRWRLDSGSSTNSVRLRVLRPVAGKMTGAGSGALLTTVSGLNVFENERLPVKAGDTVGLDNEDSALVLTKIFAISIVDFFQPYLPDGGPATSPSGELSSRRLQLDADVAVLPTSTGSAASCPGNTGATVTVSADADVTDRAKAVRFRVDGGPEQVTPTTPRPPRGTRASPRSGCRLACTRSNSGEKTCSASRRRATTS
jgi:hypothetical protein